VLAWDRLLVAKLLRLSSDSIGSFFMRIRDLAYIGLPVVTLPWRRMPARGELARSRSLRCPLVVITNTLGVLLLLIGTSGGAPCGVRSAGSWRPTAAARTAGWVRRWVCASGWLLQSVAILADGLRCAALHRRTLSSCRAGNAPGVYCSVLKVASSPAGWPLGRWIGLSLDELRITLLFSLSTARPRSLSRKTGGDEALRRVASC